MKANRKFIENQEAISAVIGVILMVAITVAIGAVAYLYFTGMLGSPKKEAENAGISIIPENGKIKITLTKSGDRMPSTGYAFSNSVSVRLNGTLLPMGGISGGNTGWEIGESLYIGNAAPALDDIASDLTQLGSGDYSVTVTVIETVIYDGIIKII